MSRYAIDTVKVKRKAKEVQRKWIHIYALAATVLLWVAGQLCLSCVLKTFYENNVLCDSTLG